MVWPRRVVLWLSIFRPGRRSVEIIEKKYDVHKVNAVIMETLGLLPGQGEEAAQDG